MGRDGASAKRAAWVILGVGASLASAATVRADPIQYNYYAHYTRAEDGLGGAQQKSATVMPTYKTFSHTAVGGTASSSQITTFSTEGMDVQVEQARGGDVLALSEASGYLDFTALEDTPYAVAGAYKIEDLLDSLPGYSHFTVHLVDFTDPTHVGLLYERELTLHTPDAMHKVDGVANAIGPGSQYAFGGKLYGSLIKGHKYTFEFHLSMDAWPEADGGQSSVGNISLMFGDRAAAAVPLPGAAWAGVTLLGGLGAGRAWKRRRSKAFDAGE